MSAWPSPRVDRLGTPKAPAIRFTRAMTFGATWFTHLLRPARLLAPQYGSDHHRGRRGLLLPGFQRVRPVAGYDCSSDWTPLPAGLSPARMTSLAAPTPSSYRTRTDSSLPVSRRTAKDSGRQDYGCLSRRRSANERLAPRKVVSVDDVRKADCLVSQDPFEGRSYQTLFVQLVTGA